MKSFKTITVFLFFVFLANGVAVSMHVQKACQTAQRLYDVSQQTPPKSFNHFIKTLELLQQRWAKSDLTSLQKTTGELLTWELLYQEWENGVWVDKLKDVTTIDPDRGELISSTSYENINGEWVNSFRILTEFDANQRLVSMTFEEWENNNWVPQIKLSMEYDAAGNQISELGESFNADDEVWENSWRNEFVYDANGFVIETKNYVWDSNAWMEIMKTSYTNNADGLPTEELSQVPLGGGEYMNSSKIITTYDASGRPLTETSFSFNFISQAWEEQWMTTHTYGETEVTELEQTWNGAAWENTTLSTYTLDGKGQVVESLYQSWDGSAWVNESRDNTRYNEEGWEEEVIFQEWDGGWQNIERWLFTYGGTGVADKALQTPAAFTLGNYPNPFNPSTTISFSLPESGIVRLQIYNAQGRLINTLIDNAVFAQGEHKVVWNGRNALGRPVSSGLYFYTLSSGDMQRTARCLFLK